MLPITTLKWCSGPSGWTLSTKPASLSKRPSVSIRQMLQDFWWPWWGEDSTSPVSISLLSGGRELSQQAPLPEAREGDGWIRDQTNVLPAWPFSSCNWMSKWWLKRGQSVASRSVSSSHLLNGTRHKGLSLQMGWAFILPRPHKLKKWERKVPCNTVNRIYAKVEHGSIMLIHSFGVHVCMCVCVCVCMCIWLYRHVFWEDHRGQTHKKPAADLRLDASTSWQSDNLTMHYVKGISVKAGCQRCCN